MPANVWYWLWFTPGGLLARVAGGGAIFLTLMLWDFARSARLGRPATRWKEYLFLLGTTAAACAYGVVNDQVTCTISWEYFYYGKGLWDALGGQTPPDAWALRFQAARIGAESTWAVGLLLGAVVLIANNPRRNRPQLPYRHLCVLILWPLLAAAVFGAVLGLTGLAGAYAPWFPAFPEIAPDRFARFQAVWGVHLGGYVGGALGGVAAVVSVLRQRRARAPSPTENPEQSRRLGES